MRLLLGFSILLSICAASAEAANRALIIGNDDYRGVPRLEKAVGDARAITAALKRLGFEVTKGENLDLLDTVRLIAAFEAQIEPGDTIFFHFSGHGVEIDRGENLLLPVDVPKPRDGQQSLVRRFSVSANEVISGFRGHGARLVLAVLDACRDNPFLAGGVRSVGGTRGLGRMDAPSGTFILFSAGAGQLARDRLGENDPEPVSVFTRAFLPQLTTPGLTLVDIAKRTQGEVRTLTAAIGHEQTPAYYDQVVGNIVLLPGGIPASAAPGRQEEGTGSALCGLANDHWQMVKDSASAAAFEEHLAVYRSCPTAPLARARLAAMETPPTQPAPVRVTPATPQGNGPAAGAECVSAYHGTFCP